MEINSEKPVWVNLFLRGGMDGLSFVFPNSGTDREIYEAERPVLKVTAPKDADFKLNASLSLHPSAKELYSLYQKKELAVIHAVGLSADSRSHFDAQNLMEQGAESKARLLQSGWIARFLHLNQTKSNMPVVSIGNIAPTSLYTFDRALVIDALRNHRWPIPPKFEADFERALRSLYALEAPVRPWLSNWGTQTIDMLQDLNELASRNNNTNYPKNEVGGKLQTLSRILIEKPEIEMATVDMGGWDTHKYQEGTFNNLVGQLSQSVSVFYDEVSKKRPIVMTIQTEFGRRLKENFSRGTDHGHGGVMLVLGAGVNGGMVHGKWPGLKTESLYQRADLAVTTDYRAVLSEILFQKKGFTRLKDVFPGFAAKKPMGLFHAS